MNFHTNDRRVSEDGRPCGGLGRLVFQQGLAPQDGIAEVLPSQVANGLHIAALFYDGVRVGTVKITVSK